MADATCELIWLTTALGEMHCPPLSPATLFCDNQSVLYIASNPVYHERTKHVEIDCHVVREFVEWFLEDSTCFFFIAACRRPH